MRPQLQIYWLRIKRVILALIMNFFESVFYAVRFLMVLPRDYLVASFRCIVPPGKKSIAGQIAVVTGTGHGIGREIAIQLAKHEALVVLLDINQEGNMETAGMIKHSGGKAFPFMCDVTSSSRVANVFDRIRHEVGHPSILVNNAGILNGGTILDMDEVAIRRTFEINTLSHFWTVKECLPEMMKRRQGHIMNVCSMASYFGVSYLTDYCASKHAAIGFSEALIDEFAQNGHSEIKVTALCPMYTNTGMVTLDPKNSSPLLSPAVVAEKGVDGMLRNYEIVTVPTYYWLSVMLKWVIPRKTSHWMQRQEGIIKPKYPV